MCIRDSSKGAMIPLSAFTTIETRIGAESLTKYNTYVSALISGAAADGYSSGEALNIMAKLIREQVGRSFGYEWTSCLLYTSPGYRDSWKR